jgi:hypothetical protein
MCYAFQTLVTKAKQNLIIVRDGNARWGVMQTGDQFVIVYSNLTTREAAELALDQAAYQIADSGNIFGPSAVNNHWFERNGWFLKTLRDAGVELGNDAVKSLAFELAEGPQLPVETDDLPF